MTTPTQASVALAQKLALARSQLVDARSALALVMADVNALPPQLKTSVVEIIEGACQRVQAAEQAVVEADALSGTHEPSPPSPASPSLASPSLASPSLASPSLASPGLSEHGGMIAFFMMCAAAGVARWVVGE